VHGESQRRYLFGPVPSRRFGRSLGVDLVPYKTCSFNCVFCQLGRTTRLTTVRREYVPTEAVVAELEEWGRQGGECDYITLSGSGEPTLHLRFGMVLEAARKTGAGRTALLTNGSLLREPDVRRQAALADVVKVSLSAWDQESLQMINRPAAGLDFAGLLYGLEEFRKEFGGQMWLEVFVVPGMNSAEGQIRRIAAIVNRLGVDRIHLNTAVRPAAEATVKPAQEDELRELARFFVPPAEVVAAYRRGLSAGQRASLESIRQMLMRRPCTARDLAEAGGLHPNEVGKYLGQLTASGEAEVHVRGGERYYRIRPQPGSRPDRGSGT